MNRLKLKKLIHALAFVLIVGLMFCCSDEHDSFGISNGKEKLVTFSVKVPGSGAPKTYALSSTEEDMVKDIMILLFDNEDKYDQYVYGGAIKEGGTSNQKTFTAKIPAGTYNNMVILANSKELVTSKLSKSDKGQNKEEILEKLVVNVSAEKGWNSDPQSTGYVPIPMWGVAKDPQCSECGNKVTIADKMNNLSLSLVRMVAKIDVGINPDAPFKLNSVHLYNYNTSGRVSPMDDNLDPSQTKAIKPSLPSTPNKTKKPISYSNTTPDNPEWCKGVIYTCEANQGSSANLKENTCLVVGGYYDNSATESFYRIDFAKTENGTTTYLDLLRNHSYNVTITGVSAPGYDDKDVAFNSKPANITANIVPWDDDKYIHFAVNDQYILGVSQAKFNFSQEERTASGSDNTLSIFTDHPQGWNIDKEEIKDENGQKATWFTCSQYLGAAEGGDDIKLFLDKNDTGDNRTAFINITTDGGRLILKVKVTQSHRSEMSIRLTTSTSEGKETEIDVLEFPTDAQAVVDGVIQPKGQTFKVEWFPKDKGISFTCQPLPGATGFDFDTSAGNDNIPAIGSYPTTDNGEKNLTIRPAVIEKATLKDKPFPVKSSNVIYTVTDGLIPESKMLTLRQVVYNLTTDIKESYILDDKPKTFKVFSNSAWRIKEVSDPSRLLADGGDLVVGTTGGYDIVNGKELTFTVKDNVDPGTIDIVFERTGTDIPLADATVTIKLEGSTPKSNCYILAPGGKGILIPVSRANDAPDLLGIQLGADDIFTAELVWTDNSLGLNEKSNIAEIEAIGKGSSGNIRVKSGSAEGNAVVAVKKEGKTLWSWHIWVTDYTPKPSVTGGFMDRNLGALNTDGVLKEGSVNTLGLLYQWGRKDPFPGASSHAKGTTDLPIYDIKGAKPIKKELIPTNANPNLKNAFENPITFYRGTSTTNNDWYSANGTQNNELWTGAAKTKFDPCPEGWRVPKHTTWTGSAGNGWLWSVTNFGQNSTDQGGYYPAAAYRGQDSGVLRDMVGKLGAYHSTDTQNKNVSTLYFYDGNFYLPEPVGRACGASVRCVQE